MAAPQPRFSPPCGTRPKLEWCAPGQLRIDAAYQRSMEDGRSRDLVARIARNWNWDMCQPLTVARRGNGHLYVIDGQHRLAAARRRGDIAELPCVVTEFADQAAEAASFVAINQQRKPLSKMDLFRAAVAGKEPRALLIAKAMERAGLSVAAHCNYVSWKPGQVQCIAGIERCWDRHGRQVTEAALLALGRGFAGQVLRYGGTLFRGIVRICVDEMKGGGFDPARFERFVAMLAARSQADWIKAEQRFFSDGDVLFRGQAIEELMRREWRPALARQVERMAVRNGGDVAVPKREGFGLGASDARGDEEWAWCPQCDNRRTRAQASACTSQFCKLKGQAPSTARPSASSAQGDRREL